MDIQVDFLGIGAQKSATTWLHANLRKHPELWLPYRKELHYFSRARKYPSPQYLAPATFEKRCKGKRIENEHFLRLLRIDLDRAIETGDAEFMKWIVRYYALKSNDNWYKSLFREGQGKVKGEITPAYSMLDQEDVEHVHQLFPDCKILFIMRDPIDRAWSHLRFSWKEHIHLRLKDEEAVTRFLTSRKLKLRGDYLRTLKHWEGSFPANQMVLLFFDEISADPDRVLDRICDSLGVSPLPPELRPNSRKRILPSQEVAFPVEIQKKLANLYINDLEVLADRFGSYPQQWLDKAKAILAK